MINMYSSWLLWLSNNFNRSLYKSFLQMNPNQIFCKCVNINIVTCLKHWSVWRRTSHPPVMTRAFLPGSLKNDSFTFLFLPWGSLRLLPCLSISCWLRTRKKHALEHLISDGTDDVIFRRRSHTSHPLHSGSSCRLSAAGRSSQCSQPSLKKNENDKK